MSDSKVTIAGRRYTIRTGSLCTQFRSMDAAAEQIALLHEMIERLRADVAELEECRKIVAWLNRVADGKKGA